jgi:hypothetical protein
MSRLASVILSNSVQTITLPVYGGKPSDQYILIGADGLGPPEVDVTFGQSVYRGGIYQGSVPKDREIVLLVGLNPLWLSQSPKTPAILRAAFYTLMSGSDPVVITLNNIPSAPLDYVPDVLKTSGYIRRIEIAPFSKEPQVQVTIGCPSPYLESTVVTDVAVSSDPTLDPIIVNYDGTAICGFEMDFVTDMAGSSIRLRSQVASAPSENLVFPGNRVTGETFQVNTNSTGRKVYWYSAGSSASGNITGMCSLTPAGIWPSLHPGQNTIFIRDGSGPIIRVKTTKFRYTAKYWGI